MKKLLFITTITLCIMSCQKTDKIENIVVIGGGLMGSSTAWELSHYGEDVILIEQQDSIYTFGSSFGNARITRSLGSKNDIFSYLNNTSVAETEKLVGYLNEYEGEEEHTMEDIYRTSPVTYIRYESQENEVGHLLMDRTDNLVMDQANKYEFAPNKDKALELFGMNIPDSSMIIREHVKYSGTLNPRVLIAKLQRAIQLSENKVLYNTKVTSLKKVNELYEIQLINHKTGEKKKLLSKKVVSAAGPYNAPLVKDIAPYFDKLITTKRLFLSFLKIKNDTYKNLTEEQKIRIQDFYPVIDLNPDGLYAMIEQNDNDGIPIIKVGGHYLRTDIENLDKVWQKELSQEEIQWSKINTINYLNTLGLPIQLSDLEFYKGYSCVYSLTTSEVPYVTPVIINESELDPNFVLLGGMSGVGAKGSLAYGLIAANYLLNKHDTSEIYQITKEALGPERLKKDILQMEK